MSGLFVCFVVAAGQLAPPVWPASAAGPRVGEVRELEVKIPGEALRNAVIEGGFDVSRVQGDVVTVHATPEEQAALEALGLRCCVVPKPPVAAKDGYHDYDGVTAALEAYAAAYPDLCRLFSLGQSVQGRELWVLQISDNPGVEEDEPEFKYISTIHGDEPVGTENCLNLIGLLLEGYGVDARLTDLVNETDISIMPLMNPDGLELYRRTNAEGYDLNRRFPVYPTQYSGFIYDGQPLNEAGRPPEVQHVMRWTADNSFVLSGNIHTGEIVVNYPYDNEPGIPNGADAPTPDDLLCEDLARAYARYNPTLWNSLQFPQGITNGCDWYSITGGLQDWTYRYVGCIDMTLEIAIPKRPTASQLPQYWDDNRESMLSYLEGVHWGVRGLVTDAVTGAPLYAKVIVEGNAQPVFTDPDVGDYHRMLLPGAYNLAISADGYVARTVPGVAVLEGEATRADVALLDPDIDNDGRVGATDVQLVVNAALGIDVPYVCDFDGGGVTATDLQKLINVVMGRR